MAAVQVPEEAHQRSDAIPGAFPDADEAALSSQQTLQQAVYARRAEYTEPKSIRVKIGTWNVGNFSCENDIGAWFAEGRGADLAFSALSLSADEAKEQMKEKGDTVEESMATQEQRQPHLLRGQDTLPVGNQQSVPAGTDVDLYVLGLQEIVDVASPTEALRPYVDPAPAARYKTAIQECLPPGYELVAEQQLIGLLLLVYVSPELSVDVKSVCTSNVGTGLMGYMGNKGAVAAHVILGEATRLLFINSHLAAGSDKAARERRNWDAGQISARTRFIQVDDPSGVPISGGEGIGDEDFAFWFGDLNYRLDGIPGDDVRHLLSRHVHGEENANMKTDSLATDTHTKAASHVDEVPDELDPDSLQTTIASLWPHDELLQQIKQNKAFHQGWHEGPVRFLPTYKYDVGKVSVFDSSEKRRGPSWCDRILYRTRNDYIAFKQRFAEEEEVRRRDEEMKARGLGVEEHDDGVIFDYNPDEDGKDEDYFADPNTQQVQARSGTTEEILQEYYTSHQRVLSSDHKPLDAIFSLTYRAAVPEKKSKVHSEVARELDRAENEGRPMVTIVIERASRRSEDEASNDANEQDTPDSKRKNVITDDLVHFGSVKFNKTKQSTVTVANTGQVPATFGFIDRPVAGLGEEGPMPPWLSASFDLPVDKPASSKDKTSDDNAIKGTSYTLEPGDTGSITLMALVASPDLARNLNDRITALDEILILRVKNGRDHFIPVQGRWVRGSSAGSTGIATRKSEDSGEGYLRNSSPIERLRNVAEDGIRRLQSQKPTGIGNMTSGSTKTGGIFGVFRGGSES